MADSMKEPGVLLRISVSWGRSSALAHRRRGIHRLRDTQARPTFFSGEALISGLALESLEAGKPLLTCREAGQGVFGSHSPQVSTAKWGEVAFVF